jgi:heptaprenyl diphosphate synthase
VAPANPLLAHATLAGDLQRVEEALRGSVRADDEFLTEVASHLILAGGKRQRPAFTALASEIDQPTARAASAAAVSGGVSCELVHLGSLYHDDVMDDATMRRTVESVNARWGNLKAILAGDFLLAKASEIAASLGTEVAGLLAATIARLCEGQVIELQHTYNAARTEEQYLRSITGKTAALFSTACRIGGLVAELPRPQVDALTSFGLNYGIAFQIVDDILDVIATDEQLGKPSGHDLVEGVYTLPVIRTLVADPGPLPELLGRVLDDEEREKARDHVRHAGQIPSALGTATTYVDAAVADLAPFGETPAAATFAAVARHLVDRVAAAGE